MQQQKEVQSTKKTSQVLTESEYNLRHIMNQFQTLLSNMNLTQKYCYENNQKIITIFISSISRSYKGIELMVRFLDDRDLMNLAASCRTLYKLIYSPLGYRIIMNLRPAIMYIKKQVQMPKFNKALLQNLCTDRSLVDMDEDDVRAHILTMKTNLMAAKHKLKQIQICNYQYDLKKKKLTQELSYVGGQRDQQMKNIDILKDQIDKMKSILQLSSINVQQLKKQQQRIHQQRQNKFAGLQVEKGKLQRQKELLIKKIKSQQKQRQDGLIYAREVQRIISMLNKLTSKVQK